MISSDLAASSGRIYRWMALVAAAGSVGAVLYGGVPWLAGFVTGAFFSALNFWFWHRLVRRIGEPGAPGEGPQKASAVVFGLRYLLFGGAAYVTLYYFEGSLFAALLGCFVAVAAVILEILVELIYGT